MKCVVTLFGEDPEIICGPGEPEEDHQLHQCCWTGRVGEREEV